MVTTQAFKTAHNLSDSSFKRLVAKVKSDRPDIEQMTVRTGNEWEILHPELLEAKLAQRVKKSEVTEVITAEIVPANQVNAYGSMELFKQPLSTSFDYQTALAEFQLPTVNYVAVSTASDVQRMQEEMLQVALVARQNRMETFEALKRQAIEEGTREGQELARLRTLAAQNALQGGTDFLAQSQGLSVGV